MFKLSKELYDNISKHKNCFEQFEDIESVLVYGDINEEMPYISYVIPTFCRPDLLVKTIKSILKQKEVYSYEIIIVDNSEDFTNNNPNKSAIERIDDKHVRLYVNEKNLGQAGNWNRGIELARGKYVSLIHDDDLLNSNYSTEIFKCIHNAEKSSSKVGIIKVKFLEFNDENNIPVFKSKNRGGIIRHTSIDSMINGFGLTNCPTCGIILNPEAVIEAGGFNMDYYPSFDYILGQQICECGYSTFVTEDVLGLYRIGVNDTLKRENLIGFCEADYLYREYLYSRTKFGSLFGNMFRRVQYRESKKSLQTLAKRFGQDISLEEFNLIDIKDPSHLATLLFKIVRKLIRVKNNKVIY